MGVERTPAETEMFEEPGTGLIFAVCIEVSFFSFLKAFLEVSTDLWRGGHVDLFVNQ